MNAEYSSPIFIQIIQTLRFKGISIGIPFFI